MVHHCEPTKSEVLQAATSAISVFRKHELKCCLVGGVACSLFGNSRVPGDVDLVVLTTIPQEHLKRLLTDGNLAFYTVAAKTPGATYRVLWYRLSTLRSCKVDILTPGTMNIPNIPPHCRELKEGLPCMPLAGILLLKLQAWEDHRAALLTHLKLKQHTDVRDLRELLIIARAQHVHPTKKDWLSDTLIAESRRRVRLFVLAFPDTAAQWRKLDLID